MAQPSIRISPDEGLTATINGNGAAFSALRGASSRTFTGTFRDAVKKIAEIHKWNTSLPKEDPSQAFDKPREPFSQGNMSDWKFLQMICRWSSCDAFMAPDPDQDGSTSLFIRSRKEDNSQKPLRAFVMRGNPNFIDSFPMFDFVSDAIGVWLPGAASKVSSADIHPDSKETEECEATSETVDEESLGERQPSEGSVNVDGTEIEILSATGDTETGDFVTASSRDPARTPDEVVNAHRGESVVRGGVNSSFTTFGIPEMFTGELYTVSGLGIFNSAYRCMKLTHRALAGEWTMHIEGMNNAASETFLAEALSLEPPKVNTQVVEGGSDNTSSLIDAVEGGI
jgi:hypothetical protein